MQYYQTKAGKITGTNFKEVYAKAFSIFLAIKKKSKRKPHIRSKYFRKEKIFLHLYWEHLFGKENWRDRMRRVALYAAALEIMQKSTIAPEIKQNPNKKSEILYRFFGATKEKEKLVVQIKEDVKSKQKFLISIFPA